MRPGNHWNHLLCIVGLAVAHSGISFASDEAVRIKQGTDLPAVWKKDQHLYVKGSLGVSSSKLNALEKWLDQNAPNWTVVLMVNAQGERFTEAGGRSHRGMDAVEFALGQSLPNKTAFGGLKHPETGEANGAYFLLFLQERKLSYFGSEVYDKRNLGEKRWKGNLDGPAIRAMRSGGRLLDAAKDTIKNIDQQLIRKLSIAKRDRQRAADRAQRLKVETDSLIQTAQIEIKVADNRAKELAHDLGNPSGDLVRPEIAAWSTEVEKAKRFRASTEAAAAGSTIQGVRRSIGSYLAKLDGHVAAPRLLLEHEKTIENTVLQDESKLARVRLAEAQTASQNAQDAHARADSNFKTYLTRSKELLSQAVATSATTAQAGRRLAKMQEEHEAMNLHPGSKQANTFHHNAGVALSEAEDALKEGAHNIAPTLENAEHLLNSAREANRKHRQRQESKRATVITGSSVGGIAIFLLALMGNLRRRDERDHASSLHTTWDRTLKEKLDGLFALMDRAAITVGSIADVEERGYTGEPLRLGKQTIKDVDELFIMSSCVDDIFEQARELITPQGLLAKILNFFSASRYKKAIRLLRDEPVRFEAGDQIERVIKGKRPEWSGLLGRKEDYQAFAMSLNELVTAFDERAQRALDTLDLIERSWETIPERLATLQASIDQSEHAEAELRSAAALDDLFALKPVFLDLLPGAQEAHQNATRIGTSDPVQALRGPATEADRMAADANALVVLAKSVRADLLPSLEESCEQLRRERRKVDWAGESLSAFSQHADDLAEEAVRDDRREGIAQLGDDLAALGVAATSALELENALSESTTPEIQLAEKLTVETRESLGSALNLSADLVLRETDLDPSEKLRSARAEVVGTRAALDRGAILAARAALLEAHKLTDEANAIIERSVTVQREFADVTARAKSNLEALESDLPTVEGIVRTLSANIAPSALQIGEASPESPNGSVTDLLTRARDEWKAATKSRSESHSARDQARLLEASTLLDQCADRTQFAVECCQGVRDHEELLEETSRANTATFQKLEARTEKCRALAEEFHATAPSRAACSTALASLDQLRLPAAGAGLDDPFDTRDRLQSTTLKFDQFEAGITADQLVLEEARRSAEAAINELSTARQLAQTARTDNIVDSPQTTSGLAELDCLEPRIEEVRARLQIAHEDWEQLDQEADQIAADASRFAATLRGELRRAEEAVAALQAAHREARRALRWQGRYGVSILGNPGASGVGRARGYLTAGDYLSARRAAVTARRAARAAITRAETKVRRERSRRNAAARRRRQQSSSLLSSSRSSFGSSFGSSSSSSGFSSSSFSSGSGTSRSGW